MTRTVREHVKTDVKKENEQKVDFKHVSSKREDVITEKERDIRTNMLLKYGV